MSVYKGSDQFEIEEFLFQISTLHSVTQALHRLLGNESAINRCQGRVRNCAGMAPSSPPAC